MKHSTKLITALDVDSFEKSRKLVDLLFPEVKIFKVGLQLYLACGDKIIRYINKKGGKVFLDLKFHDIPNTVGRASAEIVKLGVLMFNVHAQGGKDMMRQARIDADKEAKRLRKKRPVILGVTVLTSQQDTSTTVRVMELAREAREAGLDGVVCSANEAVVIRRGFGREFIIVTPGIRPAGAQVNDQKRISTPAQAKSCGVDYIVVGRPIIEADKPLKAAQGILADVR
ncbi:MAG: orotidine-5'-phosphate decarboxylase [Candidatus Omnitrophica bacterium]|nr:orotidine-5'-phosphate decarboxylase [Candidatus Omnitrophota bacterium]